VSSKNRMLVFREEVSVSWLVAAVPPDERARVEEALAFSSRLSLPRGSSLGFDRFETVSLVSVEEGIVFVSVANRDSGRQIIVGLAGPRSILVAPAAHERLEALTDARLTLIPTNTQKQLSEMTSAATIMTAALADEVRNSRQSLALFGNRHHTNRVRGKLIQLAPSHGAVQGDGLLIDLPLTHELLADMVGSTRETVTRSLARLAQEGGIRQVRGRYVIRAFPWTSKVTNATSPPARRHV
jgi:CRP-like cAMP-binding protein